LRAAVDGGQGFGKLRFNMSGKILKYVVLAVIAANLAIVAIVFEGGSTPPPRPMPNPNGYDDFVKAAQMIGPASSYDYSKMSQDELSSFASSNAAALKLVHDGLKLECRVPPDYLPSLHLTIAQSILRGQIYRLGFYLCGEGRLAALEGNTNDAAVKYLDAIRFSQESSRGGLGKTIPFEREASTNLQGTTAGLNGSQCREIARALETVDAKEEPVQDCVKRTEKFIRSTANMRDRIYLIFEDKYAGQRNYFITQFQANVVNKRKMMIDFAARAYELEKGKPPQSVSELVPDYLTAVPKDPVTGKEMGLGR
jgi:hypothetical protein